MIVDLSFFDIESAKCVGSLPCRVQIIKTFLTPMHSIESVSTALDRYFSELLSFEEAVHSSYLTDSVDQPIYHYSNQIESQLLRFQFRCRLQVFGTPLQLPTASSMVVVRVRE